MPSSHAPPALPPLQEQMVRESCAMVRHLVTNGIRVPPSVVHSADGFERALEQRRDIDVTALASTHERLARLVAPAKPGTLFLLERGAGRHGAEPGSLGSVRLVRELVRIALVCVGIFIVLSVVTLVDAHETLDLFGTDRGDNHPLLVVKIIVERLFWLAAAGIGAAFAMLFALNDQLAARTFDPDETPSYWVKFFLGVVAGFILVALVPMNSGNPTDAARTGAQALGPPTIAMLGGFSASAVYRVLLRLVEALESVFTGGVKEQAAAAEKAASARAAEESGQARMAVAGQLVEIQQRLAAGLSSDEAARQIRQVVASLVPASAEFSGALPAPSDASAAPAPPAKVPALTVVAAPADAADPSAADLPSAADPPSPAAAG